MRRRASTDTSALLAFQCRAARLPPFTTEFKFLQGRQFRADFAWIDQRLLVEIEGVVFPKKARMLETAHHQLGGRHVSVKGFERDIEKYAEAVALGYRVLRVMPKHVPSGQALIWIERALGEKLSMKWRRYQIQVRAIDAAAKQLQRWACPMPSPNDPCANDLHFDAEGDAVRECAKPIYGQREYWRHVRVFDRKDKRVIAEWHDGKEVPVTVIRSVEDVGTCLK